MEILFVLGFFVMLLVTGISLVGIVAALLVATLLMFFTGMLAFVVKMLPWLLLALIVAGIWRAFCKPSSKARRRTYYR